jgi:hypothetical protein
MKTLRAANGDLLVVVARNDNTVQVLRANAGDKTRGAVQ